MIQYVTGDILMTDADAMAHGVAPNDDFKQGLAASLREQWPALYKDFRHFSHLNHPKEGTLWIWKGVNASSIVQLYTQEHAPTAGGTPGKASLKNVTHCLRELSKEVEKNNWKSVALPKIATGVGGLDWDDVKPLIEKTFSDSDCKVYVYETFKRSEKAQES